MPYSEESTLGGAILAIPLMLVTMFVNRILPKKSERVGIMAWIDTVAGLIVAAASSVGTAALGTRVLVASLGAETVKQGVRESAVAGGVGAAVWIAALLALIFAIWIVSFGVVGGVTMV
ncbi:hypothetical protein QFC20_005081 [Naganishia adeliensis]|uniref:Uncharacterized protein n=1 Tax=Naganishia adeliensis TaxID=92952 RepID=A0ACC2VT43_9TREE|nr:hypothetical protein QFC20_005081 [Naganishia adeliensis]